MNTVQPYTRYGQPQRQQLLQQQQHVPQQQQQQHVQQQQQFVAVAPMYREQSKRPRFYAPAMSYASNALPAQQQHVQQHVQQQQQRVQQQQQHVQQHVQQVQHVQQLQPVPRPVPAQLPRTALSLQAQQSLQKFMPREMQMAVKVAIAAAAPVARGSSRIRTVQIVKPNAVRTFKVLETIDAAGVKTIKILGTSNEQPKGQHHVVKVVTQDAQHVENHVQTVKIYDDDQPLQIAATPAATPTVTRGYLPPTVARTRARLVRSPKARTLRLLPLPRH